MVALDEEEGEEYEEDDDDEADHACDFDEAHDVCMISDGAGEAHDANACFEFVGNVGVASAGGAVVALERDHGFEGEGQPVVVPDVQLFVGFGRLVFADEEQLDVDGETAEGWYASG